MVRVYATMLTFFIRFDLPSNLVFLTSENLIVPGAIAKIVWSLPIDVFSPAIKCVPRWRIIIDPFFAVSPAKSLTPRYLGLESLLFCVDPVAFVCAILS